MKRLIVPSFVLAGLLVAGAASAQQAANKPGSPAVTPIQNLAVPAQASGAVTPDPDARGLFLDADGQLTARVTFIEETTLKLRPIPNATVAFVRNRQVVSRVRAGDDGHFKMGGLQPWSVYSVFVTSPDWFVAFSCYVKPFDASAADRSVAQNGERQKLYPVAAENQLAAVPQDLMVTDQLFSAVPTGDFDAFMSPDGGTGPGVGPGSPLFGPPDMAGVPGGFVGGGPAGFVGGGGGGFAGGGGGGGGGLLGGGIGGALGAVGLALGAAALADDEEDQAVATPAAP